jgi:hypothetical protein
VRAAPKEKRRRGSRRRLSVRRAKIRGNASTGAAEAAGSSATSATDSATLPGKRDHSSVNNSVTITPVLQEY